MINTIILAASAGGMNPIVLILLMVVFFFFMIWPQMRKQKKAKAYMSQIKKGDNIVTTGGIHGKIVTVNDTYFIIEVEEGRLKIEKGAISMEMTMSAYKPKPEAAEAKA